MVMSAGGDRRAGDSRDNTAVDRVSGECPVSCRSSTEGDTLYL